MSKIDEFRRAQSDLAQLKNDIDLSKDATKICKFRRSDSGEMSFHVSFDTHKAWADIEPMGRYLAMAIQSNMEYLLKDAYALAVESEIALKSAAIGEAHDIIDEIGGSDK